jgi:hypothetical protein
MSGLHQISNYIQKHGNTQLVPKFLRNVILAKLLHKKVLRNYHYIISRRRGGRSYFRRILWYMRKRLSSKIQKFFLVRPALVNNWIQTLRLQKAIKRVILYTHWTFRKNFEQYCLFWKWVRRKWFLKKFIFFLDKKNFVFFKKSFFFFYRNIRKRKNVSLGVLKTWRLGVLKVKGVFLEKEKSYFSFWRLRRKIKSRVFSKKKLIETKKRYRLFPYTVGKSLKIIEFLHNTQGLFDYINFILRRYLILKISNKSRYSFFKQLNKILYQFIQSLSNKLFFLFLRKFVIFEQMHINSFIRKGLVIPVNLVFHVLTYNKQKKIKYNHRKKKKEVLINYFDRQLSLNYNYPQKFRELYHYHYQEYYRQVSMKKIQFRFFQKKKYKSEKWIFKLLYLTKYLIKVKFRQWIIFNREFKKFISRLLGFSIIKAKRLFSAVNTKLIDFKENILLNYLSRLLFVVYLLRIYPILTYNKTRRFIENGFIRKNGISCYLTFQFVLINDLLEYSYYGLLLLTGAYYWYVGMKLSVVKKNFNFFKKINQFEFLQYRFYNKYWKSFTNTNIFLMSRQVSAIEKDLVYRYLFFFHIKDFFKGIKDLNWMTFNYIVLGGIIYFSKEFFYFIISKKFSYQYLRTIYFSFLL